MEILGDPKEPRKVAAKYLWVVPKNTPIAVLIESVLDISTMSIDEITSWLRAVEGRGDEEEEPSVVGGKLLLTEGQWQARLKEKQQGENNSKAGSGKGGSKSRPREQRKKKKVVDGKDNRDTCLSSGKKGHWAKDCRAPRKEQANLTREDDEESLLMTQVCELATKPVSSGASPTWAICTCLLGCK
jgi:hypothetical protein